MSSSCSDDEACAGLPIDRSQNTWRAACHWPWLLLWWQQGWEQREERRHTVSGATMERGGVLRGTGGREDAEAELIAVNAFEQL